jgi:hypothetical protein
LQVILGVILLRLALGLGDAFLPRNPHLLRRVPFPPGAALPAGRA